MACKEGDQVGLSEHISYTILVIQYSHAVYYEVSVKEMMCL